ncbi:MAG: MFS transporter [Rhodovarius sp.]|nr:MFS transporter [Rhodovarius sp.]MCX7931143.1 MFS transporter [Rhodovarius sp.]MDW8315507.1 MFS transporter [Rhodovarius sp.]
MSDPPGKDPRPIAIIVASALFMQNLDSAAVATALPSMARSLEVEPARLGVAITAYLVSLTVFIPFSGWVADRFGAKRVFMFAILLFIAASAACGLAQDLTHLVLARIVQGLGGAMMVPVGRLLLLRGLRKDQMLTAMAWLTMPGMLGPISGPVLGGVLTDLFGWRSVFWINVPVGVMGLLLVAWKIPDPGRQDPGPPDIPGLLLVGGALAGLMFGIETVGRGVLPPLWPWLALAAGLLVGVLALRHCRRAARPALDLSLLEVPSFRAATLPGTLFRVGAGASPFLVPVLLQAGFGWGATESGLVSFATALGALAMKPLAQPILRWLGFRTTVVWAGLLAGVSLAACALFDASWPLWAMFLLLAVGGLFRSLQFTALNTLAFADLPPARLSAATGFFGMAQQISPALGVVLATATLEASAAMAGRHEVAAADFSIAFVVAALVLASATPFFLRLPPAIGREVSGHKGR